MKFIDLQGLDGKEKNEKVSLDEITKSDLVLWVLKANQSARKLDIELKKKFDEFYKKEKNLGRKKPKILALLTHVDKLNDKKPSIIEDALKYNEEQLTPDAILPLSLNPNLEFYNLDSLKEYIQKAYVTGINTQLNRRKIEHNSGVINSSKSYFKNIF
jgi:tRNA U34 5-carboxymethylaminomethyl modifying GTPase MnmE/TrmE